MRIACVHGLNTSPAEKIAPVWEHLLRSGGLEDFECVDVRWTSTGWFTLDAAAFTLPDLLDDAFQRPLFKSRAQYEVTSRLRMLLRDGPPTIVLAHSMGSALAFEALRTLSSEGIVTESVFFGSPFGHPVFSTWLRSLGFGLRQPPRRITHVWNDDDPIATLPSFRPVFPSWMRPVRIAVPDNVVKRGQWEHDASLYLTHPVLVRELQALQ